MTPEDARYVESLRRAAERERDSANHRLLVVAALERKVRRLEARVQRGEALFEAALRMGLQCGICEACSRGETCVDPACEMREALTRMARSPEVEEEHPVVRSAERLTLLAENAAPLARVEELEHNDNGCAACPALRFQAERDAVCVEAVRYREALERIDDDGCILTGLECREIASAALAVTSAKEDDRGRA